MNPMKRIGLMALLVVGVMPLASTAGGAQDTYPYELENCCDSGDQDADATGQVTRTEWRVRGRYPGEWLECRVVIDCQNLTPHATYTTPLGTFTADSKGNGKVSGKAVWVPPEWWWWPYVARVNADGSSTMVLMLW